MSSIPPPSHASWRRLILGELKPEFLGARVMLGRLSAAYRQKPTPETLEAGIKELRDLYEKLGHLPNIQADIKKLFP